MESRLASLDPRFVHGWNHSSMLTRGHAPGEAALSGSVLTEQPPSELLRVPWASPE